MVTPQQLMRKHADERRHLKALETAMLEKHMQEWADLKRQCEESGGHIGDDGFMYTSCIRCGYSDG